MRYGLAILFALMSGVALAQRPEMVPISSDNRSVEAKWQDDAIQALYGQPPRQRNQQPTPVVFRQVAQASSPVEIAAQNAVRVSFPTGRGGGQAGSGVYLGERLIATAYHVPQGTPGRGVVEFRDGVRANCTVIKTDKVWDQCVLEMDREHPTLKGVDVAGYNPRQGEMVYSCGFGQGFRIFGGQMTGEWAMPSSRGQVTTRDWFHHANPAVSGDSGGPVFNEQGKLIGCLWGSTGRETVATGTGRFHEFCKPLFPRIAQWRANVQGRPIMSPGIAIVNPNQGYGSCPNGTCPYPSQPPSYGGGGQTPVTPPVTPQPDPTPSVEIDYDKLVELLVPVLIKDGRLQGPQGERGPAGARGPQGLAGNNGKITPEQLQDAIAELDLSQRVLIVDGKAGGRILDDETYGRGEPIVLDVNQLIRKRQ